MWFWEEFFGVGCERCLSCAAQCMRILSVVVFSSTACVSLLQLCFIAGACAPCCSIQSAAEHDVMCKEQLLPVSGGPSALLQAPSKCPGCEATACSPLPSAWGPKAICGLAACLLKHIGPLEHTAGKSPSHAPEWPQKNAFVPRVVLHSWASGPRGLSRLNAQQLRKSQELGNFERRAKVYAQPKARRSAQYDTTGDCQN
jgi:hypothetical protein